MLVGRWDKRRKKRQPRHHPAWISFGPDNPGIPCVVCDISPEGARLSPTRFSGLPDVFTLVLSKDGNSRHQCRVVWRKKLHIGVQFIAPGDTVDEQQHKERAAPKSPQALWHIGYHDAAACMERKELAMSSLAFFIVALLIAATALFYVAGMQMRDEAGWAMEVCYIAKNLCHHPEWSGIPAALMAFVYFTAKGMEL
jgi:hypothetical protein